jgi:rare lipoprotein A
MKYINYTLIISTLFISACSIGTTHPKPISMARYKATMKPYVRRGEVIQPREVSLNQTQIGLASWYGPGFNGGTTSSGERYNMYAYTAAHKTFPLGTIVKVQNLKNGKSVFVRINDRGPFVKGRIIDCSYAAAKKIGLDRDGVAPVKLTVVNKIDPKG